MPSPFVHLHVHSHYSLLDGLGKVPEILDRVKELGMDACALTDHGALYGLPEFVQEARKRSIKPILGVEAYLVPDRARAREVSEDNIRHLTLLAENLQGYQNLLKLITDAHLNGFYRKPCIDYTTLQQHAGGLICLSGCLRSDLSQAIARGDDAEADRLIRWHLDVFGRERYFQELQAHPHIPEQQTINAGLQALARRHGIGLVATGDTHYIHPEDAEAQDVLLCVQTNTRVTDKDRLSMRGEDFSLQPPEVLTEAFRDVPEAIENTRRIAERCTVELTFGKNVLPAFPVPAGETPNTTLEKLCAAGLRRRYGDRPAPEVQRRLAYELSVIEKTGFASYFLIVQDFVNWAKRQGVEVGPGRGSAAGSIVSYLLNITDLDPLKYNLVFERFLNPDRISMPDIDLDFADDRRDEVLEYVRQRYGRDRVAQIITFGTMAARAAVRDAGRALGFPYAFCDRIAKLVPMRLTLAGAEHAVPELSQLAREDPQVRRLLDTARKLEGVARHAGVHAAGVVVTPGPLTDHVPLQRSPGADATLITQYEMHAVEDLGLLKMDFLGLKNLTILRIAVEIIARTRGENLDLDALPPDDAATYKLLQNGLTTGVFQLESTGMKRYLKELKPTEFEDIVVMISLFRPGPMELIPQYIAGKHGLRRPEYLHEALEPILKKTYGIAVYQEQVLQIARDLAGFTMGQADVLRKAIGKKIPKLLKEQRDRFVAGATAKGVERRTAERIFDFIEPFAGYSFNRSHACCYALIAYQTAYLKTHYPAEFMAALLTTDEDDTDRIAIEVAEATSMGIRVLPPDVNESRKHFTVVAAPATTVNRQPGTGNSEPGQAIRFGLLAVKNVGRPVVESIIAAREAGGPFRDLGDFFRRVSTTAFNKKAAESLAKAGALDSLGERQQILKNLDLLLSLNRAGKRVAAAGQAALFASPAAPAPPRLKPAVPADLQQRLRWEKELLGLYVSGHPLKEVAERLRGRTTPVAELSGDLHDYRVLIGGIITKIQRVVTRSQQTMVFATLEDQTGSVEVLVFPSMLEASPDLWTEEQILLIEGRPSDRDGQVKVIAETARRLHPGDRVQGTGDSEDVRYETDATGMPEVRWQKTPRDELVLDIPSQHSRDLLLKLRERLAGLPKGDAQVVLRFTMPDGRQEHLKTSFRIAATPQLRGELTALLAGTPAISHSRNE